MTVVTRTGQFVSRKDGKRYVAARREHEGAIENAGASPFSFYVYRPGLSRRPEPCERTQLVEILGYDPDFSAIPATTLPRAWRE